MPTEIFGENSRLYGRIITMRVYISADYAEYSGDRQVVDILNAWGKDALHKVEFVDTAKVNSGSVSKNSDCRICDLKAEFNRQINVSSHVIIVIGDRTAQRMAGSKCERNKKCQRDCFCTPYKQNINGSCQCKVSGTCPAVDDVGYINDYSYLRHEFEQAKKKKKKIIVVYNSLYKKTCWLPDCMSEYAHLAEPFWIKNEAGTKIGNYGFIKRELGYE